MATVFLSSRFHEFADLRRMLARRLHRADGWDALALDDGAAAPIGALQRSLREVRRADVLVLLVGDSYADWDDAPDRLSTTHEELRAALDAGIPVLAYATASTARDPRVDALLAEVRGACVVGSLSGDGDDDADGIVDDLARWSVTVDEDPDGGSFADVVVRELAHLGVLGLDRWALPDAEARRSPAYTQLVERRRMAMVALTSGETAAARGQLEQARAIFPMDWATNFLLARLVEVRGRPNDLLAVRDVARLASRSVGDLAHAPQSLADPDDAVRRRQCATLLLQARLARLTGDPSEAARFADQAVAVLPTSREGLVEQVRARALLGEPALATTALRSLVQLYPDRAVTLMRSPDLRTAQPALEQSAVDLVCDRHDHVLSMVAPGSPPAARPARLRSALQAFRATSASAAAQLAALTDAVAGLTSVEDAEQGGRGRAVAALEQRAEEVQQARALLADLQQAAAALAATRREIEGRLSAAPMPPDGEEQHVRAELQRRRTALADVGERVSAMGTPRTPDWNGTVGWCMGATALTVVGWVVGSVLNWVLGAAGVGSDSIVQVFMAPGVLLAGVAAVTVLVNLHAGQRRKQLRTLLSERADAEAAVQDATAAFEALLDRIRRHEAVAQELADLDRPRQDNDDATAAAQARLQQAEAMLLPALTDASSVGARLGRRHVESFGDVAQALQHRYELFQRAFAVYPNWGFPDYVPRRRARSGDLTRVGRDEGPGGWLAQGASEKRLVRVLPDGRLSDVAAVAPSHAALEELLCRHR